MVAGLGFSDNHPGSPELESVIAAPYATTARKQRGSEPFKHCRFGCHAHIWDADNEDATMSTPQHVNQRRAHQHLQQLQHPATFASQLATTLAMAQVPTPTSASSSTSMPPNHLEGMLYTDAHQATDQLVDELLRNGVQSHLNIHGYGGGMTGDGSVASSVSSPTSNATGSPPPGLPSAGNIGIGFTGSGSNAAAQTGSPVFPFSYMSLVPQNGGVAMDTLLMGSGSDGSVIRSRRATGMQDMQSNNTPYTGAGTPFAALTHPTVSSSMGYSLMPAVSQAPFYKPGTLISTSAQLFEFKSEHASRPRTSSMSSSVTSMQAPPSTVSSPPHYYSDPISIPGTAAAGSDFYDANAIARSLSSSLSSMVSFSSTASTLNPSVAHTPALLTHQPWKHSPATLQHQHQSPHPQLSHPPLPTSPHMTAEAARRRTASLPQSIHHHPPSLQELMARRRTVSQPQPAPMGHPLAPPTTAGSDFVKSSHANRLVGAGPSPRVLTHQSYHGSQPSPADLDRLSRLFDARGDDLLSPIPRPLASPPLHAPLQVGGGGAQSSPYVVAVPKSLDDGHVGPTPSDVAAWYAKAEDDDDGVEEPEAQEKRNRGQTAAAALAQAPTPPSSSRASPLLTATSAHRYPSPQQQQQQQQAQQLQHQAQQQKRVSVEVEAQCSACGTQKGSLYLHGQAEMLRRPYTVQMRCASCEEVSDATAAAAGGGAAVGGLSAAAMLAADKKKKRKRKGYQSSSQVLDCSICSNVIGVGGVRVLVSGQAGPGDDDAAAGVWGDPDFGVEPFCQRCMTDFKFCTNCGGGGQWRSGKWRPKEMFQKDRRNCSLHHIRVGATASHRYIVFRCPVQTPGSSLMTPASALNCPLDPHVSGRSGLASDAIPYVQHRDWTEGIRELKRDVLDCWRSSFLQAYAEASIMTAAGGGIANGSFARLESHMATEMESLDLFVSGGFREGRRGWGHERAFLRNLAVAFIPDPRSPRRKNGSEESGAGGSLASASAVGGGAMAGYVMAGFAAMEWNVTERHVWLQELGSFGQQGMSGNSILPSLFAALQERGDADIQYWATMVDGMSVPRPLYLWSHHEPKYNTQKDKLVYSFYKSGFKQLEDFAIVKGLDPAVAKDLFVDHLMDP
ncbi:hypothetical protein HK101_010718, partial [Irineochytrium annulatum]